MWVIRTEKDIYEAPNITFYGSFIRLEKKTIKKIEIPILIRNWKYLWLKKKEVRKLSEERVELVLFGLIPQKNVLSIMWNDKIDA